MLVEKEKIAGIDFGSKLAGTTAISYIEKDGISTYQSQTKKNADEFLIEQISKNKFDKIFIDAPLSLPGVYFDKDKSDYFYRECDKELNAMSPMFIGGLTARAIKLKDSFPEIEFYETYPKMIARIYFGDNYKKGKLEQLVNKISDSINLKLNSKLDSFHKLDSLLAFISGIRYLKGEAKIIGDPTEGFIIY